MSLADQIAQWIADRVAAAGLSGAVVGLSGGIDSAVVSGLCARGLGRENVLGLIMPIYSSSEDVTLAEETARTWGIEHKVIDLGPVFDQLKALLPGGTALADANMKPRLRMIVLYHHANTLGRMVVGTGNRSELLVGYFTKYGDAGVDLLPIAGLYKYQVRQLAREIGVPQAIIDRPPSAGLWPGQTDEAELGISYEQLDRILAAFERGEPPAPGDQEAAARVERMMRASEHKRNLPPIFIPPES